jgi:glycosyltransferase involved in cell wall biosynthesis
MRNNRDPRLSVVMGAYNEEEQISRTLQSLLGQTTCNFEIIVINDGSTDGTVKMVNDFDDDRIRLVTIDQNEGLPYSLNRGIEIAQGKYIARADADERSLPYRLQRQSSVLDTHQDTQAVGCWYRNIGRNSEQISDVKISPGRLFDVEDLLENGPGVAHGSMMLRKEALSTVGGYRESFQLAQDYDLWLRMSETFGTGWLHIVPEVLYERRIDVSQLQKRHRQRIYSEAAQACARARKQGRNEAEIVDNLTERLKNVEGYEFIQNEREGMYHYLIGTKLLEQNKTSAARQCLLKSVWYAPKRARPWYRLGLSLLRPDQRQTVQNWVESMLTGNDFL